MDDTAKHEMAADLCRVLSSLGSKTKVLKANQQLAKLSEQVSKLAIKESLWLCNCELITVVESWHCEEFAAKMQVICPVHGPARLGVIVMVTGMPDEPDPMDKKLAGLLREYDRRCADWKRRESVCEIKNRSAAR